VDVRSRGWELERGGTGGWTAAAEAVGSELRVADGASSTALVVFGGNRRNDVWEFDTQTQLWTEMWANDVVTSASASGAMRALAFALGAALAAYA